MLLTKSALSSALTCPTKLFYAADKNYGNQSINDTFLAALAEGGFQIGELAKLYFPGGVYVETLDVDNAVKQTDELLQNEEITILKLQ